MTDIKFIAKAYIDAGWSVVPIVKGEKRATGNWAKQNYAPNKFGATDGIAGKCGEPSGWRVDVDCDAIEAVEAARLLLPTTGLIHGRPGKPASHYWYICEKAKTTQFTDVKDSSGATSMLIEIRSTGGYTLLPPSVHPSGDTLAWESERAPKIMGSVEELYAAVRDAAIASLVARHWPGPGGRHAMTGHLAGFLLQGGLEEFKVLAIIRAAAKVAKDSDLEDRINFAQSSIARFKSGEKVTGAPKLSESLGADVVAKLRAWLKLADLDALEEMNSRHFWCRLGKDDVIGREDDPDGVVFQRVRSLYSEYANKMVQTGVDKDGAPECAPLFETWLKSVSRRSFSRVVFSPPPREAGASDYNLWTGFAVEAKAGSSCALFLEHMKNIICSGNQERFDYLIKLCAFMVQQPGTPSGVAVVLRGEPGTGKGTFVRMFQRIFGRRHFAHLDRVEDLVGFNSLISGKVVVFADEAFWAGDKREVGALKRIITEPTIRITRKGIDSNEESNCIHLFMATNEEWAVPAQLRERRFFALNVSNDRIQDRAYFNAIEDEIRTGGAEAFLSLLMSEAVTASDIREAPKTEELRVQQDQSLPLELKWWQECLTDGLIGQIPWSEWISVHAVYDAYKLWAREFSPRVLNKMEFGRRLSLFLSMEKSRARRISGNVERCWHLRELVDARKVFDARLGTSSEWPDGPANSPLSPF